MSNDSAADSEKIEQLKLALAVKYMRLVIDADEKIQYAELEAWAHMFPTPTLKKHGIIDDEGNWTMEFEDLAGEAVARLPDMLSEQDKLAFMLPIIDTATSDEDLDGEEVTVIKELGLVLGVPPKSFHNYMYEKISEKGGKVPE